MNQSSSNTTWYIVGAVVVIAAFALWYYSAQTPSADMQNSAVEQTQALPLSSGNTTADISTDLTQTLNSSAELDQEVAASIQAVQGF